MGQAEKRPTTRKKPLRAIFYIDKKHQHRWRLRSGNGRVIADCGEGYKRLVDCQRALRAIFSTRFVEVYHGAEEGGK